MTALVRWHRAPEVVLVGQLLLLVSGLISLRENTFTWATSLCALGMLAVMHWWQWEGKRVPQFRSVMLKWMTAAYGVAAVFLSYALMKAEIADPGTWMFWGVPIAIAVHGRIGSGFSFLHRYQ